MAAVPGDAEMRLAIADAAPSRAMHNRGGQCNALESYSYVTHLMWMIGTGHAALAIPSTYVRICGPCVHAVLYGGRSGGDARAHDRRAGPPRMAMGRRTFEWAAAGGVLLVACALWRRACWRIAVLLAVAGVVGARAAMK